MKSPYPIVTYQTGFNFKDLTQRSESPLLKLVTRNDLVDNLDLFTKTFDPRKLIQTNI